jgi:uncharacterized protein (DUF885 family)
LVGIEIAGYAEPLQQSRLLFRSKLGRRRTMHFRSIRLFAILILISAALQADAAPADDLQKRRDALKALLAEQWEHVLSTNPEYASTLGDKRWNDKITDYSEAQIERELAKSREFLARFAAIDTAGFPEQEALNKELMVRDLRQEQEGSRFRNWLMPVNQFLGFHLGIPQTVSQLSFTSAKDYHDLAARYRQYPAAFEQVTARMRKGVAAGLMPPKFLLEKVVGQVEGIANAKPEDSPFAEPLKRFPAAIPAPEQEKLRAELLAAIRDHMLPAYARFGRFLEEEYVPKGRTEAGLWSLPDGADRYAFRVKTFTTTDLTPEQIHQIGLREVARIEGEMLEIAKQLGYQDLQGFNAAIEKNPALRPKSGEQLLEMYRRYLDRMSAKLPQLFGRLPKAKMEVVPVEKFREKEAAAAEYYVPAPDGSRPGRVLVNTGDYANRKTLTIESTAYHEGVPGHHLQLAIAQELEDLPPFRQQGDYTAFSEGWGLYAERLGKDVGFYQDPYNDYGRLQDEMLRAIRLVVDTGLHAKRWSRDQVVQYFRAHSALDEVDIQAETDRYIAWPGQAVAYKIGQLKILELRERAKKALGDKFDIRQFHDQVLGAGALPLDVLEARIDGWIKGKKGA